jgi:hypothetical protein
MATTISSIITFVPTVGDNHKKADSERISVKLKAVKMERKQSQLKKFVEMPPNDLMKEMMDTRQQSEIKSLLKDNFVRFINFNVAEEATTEDEKAKKRGRPLGETEDRELKAGDEYERPAVIDDVFELGEYELAMEIFMHMIGSSQLRKVTPVNPALPTVTEERENEEKNSESPSGTTLASVS